MTDRKWHVALLDLPPDTVARLEDILKKLGARSRTHCENADLIFCNASSPQLDDLLAGPIREKTVVVDHDLSPRPEISWLSFLERGAADYLPNCFEAAEVRWILEAHRQSQQHVAHA